MRLGVLLLALGLLVGCGVPNSVRLEGNVTEPALTGIWFTADDGLLVLRTPMEYWVINVAAKSATSIGPVTPSTTVEMSPVSRHLLELADGQGRLCDLDCGEWSPTFAVAAQATVESPLPPPLVAGQKPTLRVPREGETWPADPVQFWVAFAAGRASDNLGGLLFEDAIRQAAADYQLSRRGFQLIRWSQPKRPRAPAELDSPHKIWRIHLRPIWGGLGGLTDGDCYRLAVEREFIKTGKRAPLVDP